MDNGSIAGSSYRGAWSRCVTGMKPGNLPTSQIGSITGERRSFRFVMHFQRYCWKNRENILLWINDLSGSKQSTCWTRGEDANTQTATFRSLPVVTRYAGICGRLAAPQLSMWEAPVSYLESETSNPHSVSGFPHSRKEDTVLTLEIRPRPLPVSYLWFVLLFYIRGCVHRYSRLKKYNKMQQYADIYLVLNYCTCLGRSSRQSSGVHKTVVAASGTDHIIRGASFLKRDQIRTFEEACSPDSMICTRGCNYSFMYPWWWAGWTPETCRVI